MTSSKTSALPQNNEDNDPQSLKDMIESQKSIGNIEEKLHLLESFIGRRFDEISMEINATSQQLDMAEEGTSKRFAEIFDALKSISFKGDGSTPANAGVELDAVVEMTEKAAHSILDAASDITDISCADIDWTDDEARGKQIQKINDKVEEIYIACSFQDITGQRIRQTLENIKRIESSLSTTLSKLGIEVDDSFESSVKQKDYATSQDDIDALFIASQEGK